ncbi:MAG TPA: alpha-galactosidase [Candidatus Dormibacteraeota bacterium]|nr:alpha-galactosidase [Candidatus Dormibacteraeota bacterium]
MDGLPAGVRLRGDRLDLEWGALAGWSGLAACCRLGDGTEHESAAWTVVEGERGRFRTACGPLRIDLCLEPREDAIRLWAEATADREVEVSQVAISGRPLLAGCGPGWVLYNGYQSWDPAGHLPAEGGPRESWWTIGLVDGDGSGLAAAACEAVRCCTRFALEEGRLRAVWREAETLRDWPRLFTTAPGRCWRSEDLLIAADGDVRARLAALTRHRPRTAPVPTGWLSWYHYGPFVSREDVLANSRLLAADPYRRLGYRVVQIDDGWQVAYGDWLPNTKFPGGIEAVSRELDRRGQVPGIWTAPFLVSAASDLACQAPEDWFVRDPRSGERAVEPRHRVFGPMYVLDASQPGVQWHLRRLFAGLRSAGVRYFKVDFLYAGAYAGLGALRAGLTAIREGVGDGYLLACGAPLLPVVGLVEGCRIGADTATPLYDAETGLPRPTVFGDEVAVVARNAAARHFLHTWFQLDADVALVGGNLSLPQARQLVTIVALSGGPFLAGDDLTRLPPERLALLSNPEVLALVGGGVAVPDWEPDGRDLPPTHWRRGDVLAIFNWEAGEREIRLRAPGVNGARDLWKREDLPGLGDGDPLRVPGHDVRLLRLRRRA